MAGFVQIIEFKTDRIDEFEALTAKMQSERGPALLATRATLTADRDRPGYYLAIVEFDSYEEAMQNSNDPVTAKYAQEMQALATEGPSFLNLDVRSVM